MSKRFAWGSGFCSDSFVGPFLFCRMIVFSAILGLAFSCCARAQQPFPGEPPATQQNQPPAPEQPAQPPARTLPSQEDPGLPTLHVTTNEVLVPTLVEQHNGQIVYGLKPSDFSLYDNGALQKIRVDDDMDLAPVSLVVCVERGRDAPLIMEEIAQLGSLLSLFTAGGRGETALVVFDSKPVYLDQFSQDPTYVDEDLANLSPGDGGAAIMDAVGFSLDLLEHQPPDHRRILLLISESRDHGSHRVNIPGLVQRIGQSNTLVLSLVFSPAKAELLDWGKGNRDGGGELNVLAPLMMTINAMRKNMPRALADLSGGEYTTFTKDKTFQQRVVELANHARNRYLLSFHPTDSTPGLHDIDVRLNQDYGADVIARTNYWASNTSESMAPAPEIGPVAGH
jgi:VWFA-related protein